MTLNYSLNFISRTADALIPRGREVIAPGELNPPLGHGDDLAQSQKSADVKHISHEYPLRAISGNWPSVAKPSGKTPLFGVLAHLVARGVWGQTPDLPAPFRQGKQLAECQKSANV